MGCFPCFGSQKKQDKKPLKKEDSNRETTTTTTGQSPVGSAVHLARIPSEKLKSSSSFDSKKEGSRDGAATTHIAAQTFTFRELAAATKNFRPESLLGEGGFGRVYKGRLENTGQAHNKIHKPIELCFLRNAYSCNDIQLLYMTKRQETTM
jgi:hypothetical protein